MASARFLDLLALIDECDRDRMLAPATRLVRNRRLFGSKGSSTTVQQSQPDPTVLADYQALIGQAQNLTSQPQQQYAGQYVAGLQPMQQQAYQGIENQQGAYAPYLNAAANLAGSAASPINVPSFSGAAISNYLSPYTANVAATTQNLFNEQNAQQQQSVIGNAVGQGAFGGDRTAIAQSELAQQQNLSEAPQLANIEQQGYSQALGEFNQQSAQAIQAQQKSRLARQRR